MDCQTTLSYSQNQYHTAGAKQLHICAMALDPNMGYYTIRLDPMAVKMCTIIFPFGKCSYLRFPMGMSGSADIFQAEMMDLVEALEYVQAYIDDLLCITRETLEDHLEKLEENLKRLRKAGLKVNAAKSFFCTHEIEYLGCMLTRGGINPRSKRHRQYSRSTHPTMSRS
jgi:hypothetical protein